MRCPALELLFSGKISCETASDTPHLTQELEALLKAFGSSLSPYADEQKPSDDLVRQLEQNPAVSSVGYAFLPLKGSIILTERYTFPTLRDFLYVELGRAILHGNAPRQCRLCGGWFLHKQGDRAAAERDAAIERLRATTDTALSASIIQQLKEDLNRL